ncbi:MAG: hypothetical protein ACI9DF_006004 [Verrucomicrobiales bacterium]|jgi:hypothetical protein
MRSIGIFHALGHPAFIAAFGRLHGQELLAFTEL